MRPLEEAIPIEFIKELIQEFGDDLTAIDINSPEADHLRIGIYTLTILISRWRKEQRK